MPKSGTNPKVDEKLRKETRWRDELQRLRKIILECGLTEEFKWGKPCYTFQGTNLMITYSLKESCAIGFFNGALLKDPKGILIMPGPNSQAGRWIKFTSLAEIVKLEPAVKAYIRESVAAEKAGLKVQLKKITEFKRPEELQRRLDEDRALKKAFEGLTPGRQRGYLLHIGGAKQAKTREARVEKCVERILAGKGLNE